MRGSSPHAGFFKTTQTSRPFSRALSEVVISCTQRAFHEKAGQRSFARSTRRSRHCEGLRRCANFPANESMVSAENLHGCFVFRQYILPRLTMFIMHFEPTQVPRVDRSIVRAVRIWRGKARYAVLETFRVALAKERSSSRVAPLLFMAGRVCTASL